MTGHATDNRPTTLAELRRRWRAARRTRTSPGDVAALVALVSTVAAVVLVRRDLRR